ncbi:MAG: flagellar motor protein MotB [Rhodopseudomonas palustris]|uniref:Flagellar motor protein MotB n=1 Tax=Rhodopseudomonas palustris TaxID=1076 RepID=A0A933RYN8_RHOPL|nr:flagellar motor protein MotB [Rhodopseudomonas palustris]
MLTGKGCGKKKLEDEHSGHGWYVSFADLMGLLVAFFVVLVSYSTQDVKKLQIVAGSMRDAFGVQREMRYSGIVETDGHMVEDKPRSKSTISSDAAASPQDAASSAKAKAEREFALASASLRQALQDVPELAEMSKNVVFEETPSGLNLELTDQDGRPMFPEGSAVPYERTRMLIARLAGPLRATALKLNIVGHTAATPVQAGDEFDAFDLSTSRANAVRQILKREGLSAGRVVTVAGKGDGEPLFPEAPTLAANRRVTISLLRENPPLPPDLQR